MSSAEMTLLLGKFAEHAYHSVGKLGNYSAMALIVK